MDFTAAVVHRSSTGGSHATREPIRDPIVARGTAIARAAESTVYVTVRGAVASLLELVTPERIVFGTDFPPGGASLDIAETLAGLGFFNPGDLRAIERENALGLLPRLKSLLS